MEELFKDVKGFEGLYQISNLGRVKSLRFNKIRILNQFLGTKGYYNVKLYKNKKQYTFEIHNLIAINFLNHKPKKGLVIDHINENKSDNRLDNLQVITHRENISKSKSRNNKSSKYTGVYFTQGKWRAMMRINGVKKHLGYFKTELEAHKCYQSNL